MDDGLKLGTFAVHSSLKSMKSKVVPCNLSGESASCFCIFPKVKPDEFNPGNTPVYLNVYDLTHINGYFYWAGLGVFHTGLEVHGVEYAFGAHDFSASGIFEIEPRQCPGFKFRKSIFMGTTTMDPNQVRDFIERQFPKYYGDTYHLVAKNCNHFCEDICYKLTGNRIPKWVNRLARLGSLCHCILPDNLKPAAVRNSKRHDNDSETKSLRSSFNCFSSLSVHQKEKEKEVAISSLLRDSHCKDCQQPWSKKPKE